MYRRESRSDARDRGAVAVEFALVLPLLLLIIFGVIDFGRAFNAQVTITQAAREGGRLAALNQPDIVARTQAAAALLTPPVSVAPTVCAPGAGPGTNGSVVVTYPFTFATPIGAIAEMLGGGGFGTPITLTANGVLPCET